MTSTSWLYLLFATIAVAGVLVNAFQWSGKKKQSQRQYTYTRRESVMTQAESAFFRRLEKLAGDRYYVFPQINLSLLLENKVKGQYWTAALSKIQRKSVDYVLVDKTSFKTVYAVELDDITHDRPNRQARDEMVDRLFQSVHIPLVRFRNVGAMTDQAIESAFADAREKSN